VPELPEVETLRVLLAAQVTGRLVNRLRVNDQRLVSATERPSFQRLVSGAEVLDVTRRGKYLLFHLSAGNVLISHLRMTGSWVVYEGARPPFTRATLEFSGGLKIAYADIRRFGTWDLLCDDEAARYLDSRLGPDPLSDAFSRDYLSGCLTRRTGPIKAVLLVQSVVAGLGNIYADESLYRAGIHPSRPARELGSSELLRLVRAVREALTASLREQAGTIAVAGSYGAGTRRFFVYRRVGESCYSCSALIERTLISGRGAYFCPCCQPSRGI